MVKVKTSSSTKTVKPKKKITVTSGIFHVHSSYNNTIISLTDTQGNVLKWASSGSIGYKGTRKKTSYAASLAANGVLNEAKLIGVKEASIHVRGVGAGKDAARKVVEGSDIFIKEVRDVTPVPHNGTRPPKRVLKRAKK